MSSVLNGFLRRHVSQRIFLPQRSERVAANVVLIVKQAHPLIRSDIRRTTTVFMRTTALGEMKYLSSPYVHVALGANVNGEDEYQCCSRYGHSVVSRRKEIYPTDAIIKKDLLPCNMRANKSHMHAVHPRSEDEKPPRLYLRLTPVLAPL